MHMHAHTQKTTAAYSNLNDILEKNQGEFFRSLEKDETNYLWALLSSCLTLAKFHIVSSFRTKHLCKSTPDVLQWFFFLQNSQNIDFLRNISLHFVVFHKCLFVGFWSWHKVCPDFHHETISFLELCLILCYVTSWLFKSGYTSPKSQSYIYLILKMSYAIKKMCISVSKGRYD